MKITAIIHRAVVWTIASALVWHTSVARVPLLAEESPSAEAGRFAAAEVGPALAPVEPVPLAEEEVRAEHAASPLVDDKQDEG